MIVETIIFVLVIFFATYLIAKIRMKILEKKKKEKLKRLEHLSSINNCIDEDLPWIVFSKSKWRFKI